MINVLTTDRVGHIARDILGRLYEVVPALGEVDTGLYNETNLADSERKICSCQLAVQSPELHATVSVALQSQSEEPTVRVKIDFMSVNMELLRSVKAAMENNLLRDANEKEQLYSSDIVSSGYYRAQANYRLR